MGKVSGALCDITETDVSMLLTPALTDVDDATVVAPSRKKTQRSTVAAVCDKQMAAAAADCLSVCLSGCSVTVLAYCKFHSLCYILVCAASLTTGNKGSIERRRRRQWQLRPFDG